MSTAAATDRAPRRFRPSDECLALLPDCLNAELVSVWGGPWDAELLFTVDTETGVATVSVAGPLDPRAAWYWDGYAGDTGVEARLRAAFHDSRVRSVVLRLDSPGGATSGLFECCDAVRAMKASTGKPMVAFAEGLGAFSAAYALAATADEIVVSRTAGVGSVGVIATAVSYADQLAKEGIAVAVVASGTLKTDLHPALPLADAAVKRLRGRVMDLAGLFFAEVAASRRMSVDDVQGLQAGCFYGAAAVSAGLADRVGTVTDAAERARALGVEKAARAAQETHMGALQEALGLSAEATDADVEARAKALAEHAKGIAALVGATDETSTHAAVAALKTNAARAEQLAAENAALKGAAELAAKAADDAARASLLATARAEGRVTPADEMDADWSAMVAAMPTGQLRTFLARLHPAVPTSAHAPDPKRVTASDDDFSEIDAHFARQAGLTKDQFLEQRRRDRAEAQKGSR